MKINQLIEKNIGWIFPLPAIIFVLLMIVFPVIYTFYISLNDWNMSSGGVMNFIGIKNYFDMFKDTRFFHAFTTIFYFTFLAVGVETVLGMDTDDCFNCSRRSCKSSIRPPFEAATVDGATKIQIFAYVTLPLLAPTIWISVVLRSIDALKTFDIIYVMTDGGPGFSSETLNIYAYSLSFGYFRFGVASSVLVALFAIVLGCSIINLKRRKTHSI